MTGGQVSGPGEVVVDGRLLRASGIGTYLRNLLPLLIQDAAPGGFRVLGSREDLALDCLRGPSVQRIEIEAPVYSLSEQFALARQAGDPERLFWSPHYVVPLVRRSRLVVTVHDLAHLALPDYRRSFARRSYADVMFRSVHRAAVRMFDSRFTADEYRRRVGVPGAHDPIVYPGVDRSWFEVVRGSPPRPRPYLLFVGNVKPHKNLSRLLAAFERIQDDIPHDLLIVGQREGFIHGDAAVVRRAERPDGRVAFTGWLTDAEVKGYVAHADALVFPSLYEGFGLPPLEAMACGCPVVCSSAASLPEVCGEAVLYCDPADPSSIGEQVKRLLGDAVLRAELVEKGRERAAGFTWDRCAAQVRQVLALAANM